MVYCIILNESVSDRVMKTELKFDEVKEEKIKLLEQYDRIVLATSLNNRVTARTVSYASEGLTIIFASWTHLKKIAQIRANAKVALCLDKAGACAVNIERIAEIVGSPQNEENKRLIEIYKKKLPAVFDFYFAHFPEEKYVFVKVTPSLIVTWVTKDDNGFLEHLDLENKRAYLRTYFEKQEH